MSGIQQILLYPVQAQVFTVEQPLQVLQVPQPLAIQFQNRHLHIMKKTRKAVAATTAVTNMEGLLLLSLYQRKNGNRY